MDVHTSITVEDTLTEILASLKRIEILFAIRPGEESRSSVAIEENSKGEPATKTKCYSGDIEGLEPAALAALRVYKMTRQAVMEP